MIILRTHRWEQLRPLSAGERRGIWAAKYYGLGHHKRRSRFRIRPIPLTGRTPTAQGSSPCP